MTSFKIPEPWGVSWSQAFYYSADYVCQCGWNFMGVGLHKVQHIVGFSRSCPISGSKPSAGVVIVECPHCFEKFWFHAGISWLRVIMKSKHWPKNRT